MNFHGSNPIEMSILSASVRTSRAFRAPRTLVNEPVIDFTQGRLVEFYGTANGGFPIFFSDLGGARLYFELAFLQKSLTNT